MGVATGCGFKETYIFPHTTYPYSSCISPFLQQHPYFFVHLKKCFSFFLTFRRCNFVTASNTKKTACQYLDWVFTLILIP